MDFYLSPTKPPRSSGPAQLSPLRAASSVAAPPPARADQVLHDLLAVCDVRHPDRARFAALLAEHASLVNEFVPALTRKAASVLKGVGGVGVGGGVRGAGGSSAGDSSSPPAQELAMQFLGFGQSINSSVESVSPELRRSIALVAYRKALEWTGLRGLSPDLWGSVHNNLANLHSKCSKTRKLAKGGLATALRHYECALSVRSKPSMPWGETQHNIAVAYSDCASGLASAGTGADDFLERAVHHFGLALDARKREVAPFQWATSTLSLGIAYANRAQGERGNASQEALEVALQHLAAALGVFTRTRHPRKWAETQAAMGALYSRRAKGGAQANLAAAAASYAHSVSVILGDDAVAATRGAGKKNERRAGNEGEVKDSTVRPPNPRTQRGSSAPSPHPMSDTETVVHLLDQFHSRPKTNTAPREKGALSNEDCEDRLATMLAAARTLIEAGQPVQALKVSLGAVTLARRVRVFLAKQKCTRSSSSSSNSRMSNLLGVGSVRRGKCQDAGASSLTEEARARQEADRLVLARCDFALYFAIFLCASLGGSVAGASLPPTARRVGERPGSEERTPRKSPPARRTPAPTSPSALPASAEAAMSLLVPQLSACRQRLFQTAAALAEEVNQTAEAAGMAVPRSEPPPSFTDVASQLWRQSSGVLIVVHCPEQLAEDQRLWGEASGPTVVVALARATEENTGGQANGGGGGRCGPPCVVGSSDTATHHGGAPPVVVQTWLGRGSDWLLRRLHEYEAVTSRSRSGFAQSVFDFLGEAATFRLWQTRLLEGVVRLEDKVRHPALEGRMQRLDHVLTGLAKGLRIQEAAAWLTSQACTELVLVPPPLSGCLVPLHALPLLERDTLSVTHIVDAFADGVRYAPSLHSLKASEEVADANFARNCAARAGRGKHRKPVPTSCAIVLNGGRAAVAADQAAVEWASRESQRFVDLWTARLGGASNFIGRAGDQEDNWLGSEGVGRTGGTTKKPAAGGGVSPGAGSQPKTASPSEMLEQAALLYWAGDVPFSRVGIGGDPGHSGASIPGQLNPEQMMTAAVEAHGQAFGSRGAGAPSSPWLSRRPSMPGSGSTTRNQQACLACAQRQQARCEAGVKAGRPGRPSLEPPCAHLLLWHCMLCVLPLSEEVESGEGLGGRGRGTLDGGTQASDSGAGFRHSPEMHLFNSWLLRGRSPSAERSMEASKSNADGKREGPSDATPAPGRWKVSRALRDAIVWMKRASTAQLQLLLSCGTGDEAEGGERLDEDRESETQDRPFSHVLFWGSMYTVGAR